MSKDDRMFEPMSPDSIEEMEESYYDNLSISDDDYDTQCEARQKENDAYLDEFEAWLQASGLKEKTIYKHLDNVAFYLNT